MCDEIELLQLLASGQKLATVDGDDYIAVHLVYQFPDSGGPRRYCAYDDWPTTPAARLAARDRELAELAQAFSLQAEEALRQARRAEAALAKVAELEVQLAEQTKVPPAVAAAATGMDAADEAHVCSEPSCGRSFKSAHALGVHRGRAHGPEVPLIEVPWRCAGCGTNTHARSLSDPARCFKCAHPESAISTNGQLAAA